MTLAPTKCINCGKNRRCLLVQACVPDYDGYEVGALVLICRPCLREDFGTLADYFAKRAKL